MVFLFSLFSTVSLLNFHIKWVSSCCTLLPLQTNVTSEPLTAVTVLLSEYIITGKVLASVLVERNSAIKNQNDKRQCIKYGANLENKMPVFLDAKIF